MPIASIRIAARKRLRASAIGRLLGGGGLLAIGLAAWTLTASVTAAAQDHSPRDRMMRDEVARFLREQAPAHADEVRIEVFPPSAHFGDCPSPRAFFPNDRHRRWGRVSVGVECAGGQVRYLQAEILGIGRYVTAAERIDAGTVIDQSLLVMRQGELNRLPRGALRHTDEAIGLLASRTIAAGTALKDYQLRAIPLVERRQSVSIEAQGEGFRVSRKGEALEDGGLGDEVRIRLTRREILTARVIGAGRVAVDF